jgi:hypothetical protein
MVNKKSKMTPLRYDFIPGPYDVICAKGKAAKSHSGNQFFRQLIQHALPVYREATSKFEKSMIVSEVVDEVRSRASSEKKNIGGEQGGGFVKRNTSDGLYYEVGDHFAREKVGQSLRDGLSAIYKSSARAKKQRQKLVSQGVADEFDRLLKRNSFVTRRMHTLSSTAATSVEHQLLLQASSASSSDNEEDDHNKNSNNTNSNNDDDDESYDNQVNAIFSQTNLEILEAFKKNSDLVDQFAEVEYSHKTSVSV